MHAWLFDVTCHMSDGDVSHSTFYMHQSRRVSRNLRSLASSSSPVSGVSDVKRKHNINTHDEVAQFYLMYVLNVAQIK